MIDLIQTVKASKGLPVTDTASRLMGKKMSSGVVYGWHIDPSKTDPSQAVTYLADAVGKTPAAMGEDTFSCGGWQSPFFMPKPCMLKYDGTVDYYLDPNDYTKKADGSPSDIANENYGGNAMMEWGLIWYKFEPGAAEGEGSFYCSDHKVDSSYKCWCNIAADGRVIKHFYTSIYNTSYKNGRLRSLSGIEMTSGNGVHNVKFSDEITRAAANNTGSLPEWDVSLYCDRQLINALLILMGKSLDTQAVFGNGLMSESYFDNSSTGELNDKGLFWGDTSGKTSFVKVFGMENWWGCLHDATAGILTADKKWRLKLTRGTSDSSTATGYNTTGSGYIDGGNIPGSSGVIKKMRFSQYGAVPSAAAGYGDSDLTGLYCVDTINQAARQFVLEQGAVWLNPDDTINPASVSNRCRATAFSNMSAGQLEISANVPGIQLNLDFFERYGNTFKFIGTAGDWKSNPYTADSSDFIEAEMFYLGGTLVRYPDNSDITPSDAGYYITIVNKSPLIAYYGGAYYNASGAGALFMVMQNGESVSDTKSTRLSCKPCSQTG